ncbi:GNAT family N-acetyltransferase [Chloroflexota bacterium]
MIRQCQPGDIERIYLIINEAAKAYEGVIPVDCYHQPYMPMNELNLEMKRVTFTGWEEDKLVGVMGFEQVKDVSLIRHAYVLPLCQQLGVGRKLLKYIINVVTTPRLLVGTWADAYWAIDFYQKHGFTRLSGKDALLREYWDIPQRQIETSVILLYTLPIDHLSWLCLTSQTGVYPLKHHCSGYRP